MSTSLEQITAAAAKHGWRLASASTGQNGGLTGWAWERTNVTDARKIEYLNVDTSVTGAVVHAAWGPSLNNNGGRHTRKGVRDFALKYLTRTA